MSSKTDVATLLSELAGGTFERQIGAALDDVAMNVVTHGKKGRVTITLDIEQIGASHQVKMTHSLKAMTPKARGKVTEELSTDTALIVGSGGKLSLFPDVEQPQLRRAPGSRALTEQEG